MFLERETTSLHPSALAVTSTLLVLHAVSKLPAHKGAVRLRSDSAHVTVSLIEQPDVNRHVAERVVHDILKHEAEALPQRLLQFVDYLQGVPVYEGVQSST